MAKIELTQGVVAECDDSDFEKLSEHKWFAVKAKGTFYAATKAAGKRIYMHRMLLDLGPANKGVFVDHINGNGLDNTRHNVKIASALVNQRNRKINDNNLSGKCGVYFRADHGKAGSWVAYGMIDGKLKPKTFGCLRRGNHAARVLAEEW